MAYVFDTNSFRALHSYYPDQFPTFWIKFNQAVAAGKVISVKEVRRELDAQVHDTHLYDWVKEHGEIFLPPSPPEMRFVTKIFSVQHFRMLVSQQDLLAGNLRADPFIIAQAEVINGCVVTEERKKPNAAKIPNVCEHFGVNYTNLQGFMEREGWRF